MAIIILKNVKYFWVNPWQIEVGHYVESYAMDVLVILSKNTVKIVMPVEGCGKLEVVYTS